MTKKEEIKLLREALQCLIDGEAEGYYGHDPYYADIKREDFAKAKAAIDATK